MEDREDEEDRRRREPRGLHSRIYPYMTEMTQYAYEREGQEPWVVRDLHEAQEAERQGKGRALVRVWTPSPWAYLNEEDLDD